MTVVVFMFAVGPPPLLGFQARNRYLGTWFLRSSKRALSAVDK